MLPSPQYVLFCYQECLRVIFLLLELKGDVEENAGPDKIDQILKAVTEIETSHSALETGLKDVQLRLTQTECTLTSLKQCQ